jgi:thioredoxin 1
MPPTLSTNVKRPVQLKELLEQASRDGKSTIVKLGAAWCAPCSRVEPLFYDFMEKYRDQFCWVVIDIDESYEIYSFLKSKRVVHGIPAFLRYDAVEGSSAVVVHAPADLVVGADFNQLGPFFARCYEKRKI